MMADIARKALVQVEPFKPVPLERRMPPERAQLRCRSRTPEGAPSRSITTVFRKLSLRSRGRRTAVGPIGRPRGRSRGGSGAVQVSGDLADTREHRAHA